MANTIDTAKHVRTYGIHMPRPAFDAQPDITCTAFGAPVCGGLCPRHAPSDWSQHMAKHVAGESI